MHWKYLHSRTNGCGEKVFENIFVDGCKYFRPGHYFQVSTSAMESERLYEVQGELVSFGKKHCVVRCPRTMKAILDAKLQWFPIAEFAKKSKDEEDPKNTVTFFNVIILDKFYTNAEEEGPRTLDLRLQVPESLSGDLAYDEQLSSVILTPSTDAARQYVADVNELLMCWFPVMGQKRDDLTAPVTFNSLRTSGVTLKWPWTKKPAAEYFSEFDASLKVHMIELGCGYHSQKNGTIGISLKLSQFPGMTRRGALVDRVEQNKRASKKRKVVNLDEEGKEVA